MTFRNIILTLVLASVSSLTFAGKVAVFDHEQAMIKTKQAETVIKALQAKPEYSRLMAQIETAKADLQSMAKEQETKGMTWSNEQVADHRKKMEYIQADLQLAAKKVQAENSAVLQKLMKDMAPKLEKAVQKIVDSEGIDVLLKGAAIYYAKPELDITGKVTAELDKAK